VLGKDLNFMMKAHWLLALLVALAAGESSLAQGIVAPPPWRLNDPTWGRGPGFVYHRPRVAYYVTLWNSPGGVTYFANPFLAWPTTRVTIVSYSPPVVPAPVAVVERPRRDADEERDLDLLLQRLDKARGAAVPADAEPLPGGVPVSVPRPILPEDRARAQQPVPDKLPLPPPAERRKKAELAPRPEPPPLPGPVAAETDPKRASAQLIKLGKEAFAAREYARAERRFQEATAFLVDDRVSFFLLAQAQFALGKYQEAAAVIEDGLRFQPAWPLASFRPRQLYEGNVAEYGEQLKRLALALDKYPDDPFLLFLYAYQLWFDNRHDEAKALFQRAKPLAIDPRFCDRFLQPVPPLPVPIW